MCGVNTPDNASLTRERTGPHRRPGTKASHVTLTGLLAGMQSGERSSTLTSLRVMRSGSKSSIYKTCVWPREALEGGFLTSVGVQHLHHLAGYGSEFEVVYTRTCIWGPRRQESEWSAPLTLSLTHSFPHPFTR